MRSQVYIESAGVCAPFFRIVKDTFLSFLTCFFLRVLASFLTRFATLLEHSLFTLLVVRIRL